MSPARTAAGPVVERVARLRRARSRVVWVLGVLVGAGGALLVLAALAADGRGFGGGAALGLALGVGAALALAQRVELELDEARVAALLDREFGLEGALATAHELECESAPGAAGLSAALSRRALQGLGGGALGRVCPQPVLGIAAPLLGAALLLYCAGEGPEAPADLDVAGIARLSAEELEAFQSVFGAAQGAIPDAAAQVRAAAALQRAERALDDVRDGEGDVERQRAGLAQAAEALDALAAELGQTPQELELARAAVDSLRRGLGDPQESLTEAGPGGAGESQGAGSGPADASGPGGGAAAGGDATGRGSDEDLGAADGTAPAAPGASPRGRARALRAAPRVDPADLPWIGRYLESGGG